MAIGAGFLIVLVCVFGAFAAFGGNIAIVMEALPHEFVTIGGGAIGAFVVANSTRVLKKAMAGLKQVFKGEKWKKDQYVQLLSLMYMLVRQARANRQALEAHIEAPEESNIFSQSPAVLSDKMLTGFITDYMRLIMLETIPDHQLQDAMENDIDRLHHEKLDPQHALQNMADGLPAIGIVAAVLGVINTMGSIDQPTEILGGMIGGALVGTFLGVLLSYCVIGPLAARLLQVIDHDAKVYDIVKTIIVAHQQNYNPTVSIEFGRRVTPTYVAPSFIELEKVLDDLPPVDAGQAARAA